MVSKTWNESKKYTCTHCSACYLLYECLQYGFIHECFRTRPTLTNHFSKCLPALLFTNRGSEKTRYVQLSMHFSVVVLELHNDNWKSFVEAEMNLKL